MVFMEWDEAYSVGVPTLDAQHRNLIRLINLLESGEAKGESLAAVLDALDRYVHEHFSEEERLMAAARYEDLEAHRAEHRAFAAWLDSVKTAYHSGGEAKYYIADTVNAYLKKWLAEHILVVDMAYKGRIA